MYKITTIVFYIIEMQLFLILINSQTTYTNTHYEIIKMTTVKIEKNHMITSK